ncbi:MAG: UTP--glucose-1-phosphate uridylyltransferase GalU [Oscillospiraceae bacterium]|jgi:UTP--glucose-1-phosphate uridylyltransferase|nr:UTP--glucose-1-phosphate uridylyltransferase GalU [Oscillospiraceae bacterium]
MKKITKAVIPAAGLGTRMLPATKTIPKEMLPLLDKPVIQYIIEEAAASGIEDILIVTNRQKSAMDDYFDYFPELEERLGKSGKEEYAKAIRNAADIANIFYVRQKETRGLGHAIWRAKRFIGDEPFAVLLGDDVMHSTVPVTKQIIDAAERCDCSAIATKPFRPEQISAYSSIKITPLADRIFSVENLNEKPLPEQALSNYAIMGRYALTPGIFRCLENLPAGAGGEVQLTDGLKMLLSMEKIVAVDFEGKRYDTGNQRGFLEATVEFALRDAKYGAWFRDYLKSL